MNEQQIIQDMFLNWDNCEFSTKKQEKESYDENEEVYMCEICQLEMILDDNTYTCMRCGRCCPVVVFEDEPFASHKTYTKVYDKSYCRQKYLKKCFKKLNIEINECDYNIIFENMHDFDTKFSKEFPNTKKPLVWFILINVARKHNLVYIINELENRKFPKKYKQYLKLFN
jgi:hypothetical protein